MWGELWRAAIVGAVIVGAGSAPAFAADGSYVPNTPDESGLNGSVVQSLCVHALLTTEVVCERAVLGYK